MTPKEIEVLFAKNVCNGFLQYCRDNKIVITNILKQKNTPSKDTVYSLARGEKTNIYSIILFTLPALLDLESPSTLEQYWVNHCKNSQNQNNTKQKEE